MPEVRIQCNDLPLRARSLKGDELPKVFGGCMQNGKACVTGSECCSNNCVKTGVLINEMFPGTGNLSDGARIGLSVGVFFLTAGVADVIPIYKCQ
jgi:hypothetical protein